LARRVSAPGRLIADWMNFPLELVLLRRVPLELLFREDDPFRPIGDFRDLAAARPPLRCAALDGPRLAMIFLLLY
jgi:hypothetical protein